MERYCLDWRSRCCTVEIPPCAMECYLREDEKMTAAGCEWSRRSAGRSHRSTNEWHGNVKTDM